MPPPPEPSDPPKRTVDLPDGPLFYSDAGRGPVVLAVHGSPGSGRDFRWLAPPLEARCRVLRVDLRGHGDSPASGRSHWTVRGRAATLERFLDALDLRDVVVLGHSIGGPVAIETALLAPGRVRAVGLLSSIGARKHRFLRGKPVAVFSAALSVPPLRALLAPLLGRAMEAAGFPRRTPDRERIDSVHAVARVDFAERAAAIDALRAAGLPTLVAWTCDDPLIEPAIFEELAAACPPGPRLAFPDGGHNPQKRHASELAGALLAWIDELEPR